MLTIAVMQMALYWTCHFRSEMIDYLLMDAWDIENCAALQTALWFNFWTSVSGLNNDSRSLDVIIQLSRRVSALGQVIHADIIHDLVRASIDNTFSPQAEFDYNDIFEFLVDQGADIEYRDTFRKETALLVAAELDDISSLNMIPVLLRLDADYSAVDYKGRGPLHLTLKPSRTSIDSQRLHSRAFKDKLVHLLQAGCSIHAVDNYGRTPTDVARKWRRTKAWEAALEAVGKLECGRSECQCEIVVRLPKVLPLSGESFTLVPKDCDRRATDICRRQNIPNLAMQLGRHSAMGVKSMRTRIRRSIPSQTMPETLILWIMNIIA